MGWASDDGAREDRNLEGAGHQAARPRPGVATTEGAREWLLL